jgi:predicted membrane-bound spermidine synthase
MRRSRTQRPRQARLGSLAGSLVYPLLVLPQLAAVMMLLAAQWAASVFPGMNP